jgi:hypothetical protein
MTEFPLPRVGGQQLQLGGVFVGHDGNLWGASGGSTGGTLVLVRVGLGGDVHVVSSTALSGTEPTINGLTLGPDGHLWGFVGYGYQTPSGRTPQLVRDNLA